MIKYMKLVDIFPIDLYEVFQTKIQPDSWHTDELGDRIGTITIDNELFQIVLETGQYKDFNFINIAFRVWSNEHSRWSEDATLTKQNAAKIIGAIVNATCEELHNHTYDALIFAASDHADKRMRIYNWIASRYTKEFGNIRQNIPYKDGKLVTVVCTKEFCDNESIDDVIKELELNNSWK